MQKDKHQDSQVGIDKSNCKQNEMHMISEHLHQQEQKQTRKTTGFTSDTLVSDLSSDADVRKYIRKLHKHIRKLDVTKDVLQHQLEVSIPNAYFFFHKR